MGGKAVIWWVRKDLRLADNPCLSAALAAGGPVIPVAILDPLHDSWGAAPRFRWGLGLGRFAETLEQIGGRLILRRGDPLEILKELAEDCGAGAVAWSRHYDPGCIERDTRVKAELEKAGLAAKSHPGHLLFEPWRVETKTGGHYKVFTPMWKALRGSDLPEPERAPARWPAPDRWPATDSLEDWALGAPMHRAMPILKGHQRVGEAAAGDRLAWFLDEAVEQYDADRDIPGEDGTSRMSPHLAWGEIGPRSLWHAALRRREEGSKGAETFLKELVWREFAYHLAWHTPRLTRDNWREEWDAFPWNERVTAKVRAWQQGRTGIPFVDAAMREMWVTGTMHNRGRMIVASYLTKHLMTHWRIGMRWFEDCLTDWDPASNALGWQWSAGSGPDATPYFRVFNPVTQLDRFDRNRRYADAWIAEGRRDPSETALSYFEAIPESWGLSPSDPYPDPVVTPEEGRRAALEAYEGRSF
ncbi:cryptochrome/photolyase family protein [Mangrovicoccus algicola]|uniref:Deoxyribodipyrimidine photo-lyase n=1 Tax=Mangrovicoccus algicola TaxID=2771008 RepID=A0A8J7CU91_9RHOB|nr:deoxyribodipyrimidine photo-lyase [Mangrovicoccus algicola]MBE3637184.1 deoxyribodipyrimidine photo-lyase [Mangrovicoccus algicola]